MPRMVLDFSRINLDETKCRLDVSIDHFDNFLEGLKNISAKNAGGTTPCLQGSIRQGMWRQNVQVPLFDEIRESLEKR